MLSNVEAEIVVAHVSPSLSVSRLMTSLHRNLPRQLPLPKSRLTLELLLPGHKRTRRRQRRRRGARARNAHER